MGFSEVSVSERRRRVVEFMDCVDRAHHCRDGHHHTNGPQPDLLRPRVPAVRTSLEVFGSPLAEKVRDRFREE